MKKTILKLVWEFSFLFILLTPLSYSASTIEIEEPWIREVPPASSVTAAYMIIENKGDEDDKLIEINTTVSNYAEIHTSSVDEKGIARMKKVEVLDIPSGKSVELKPSGDHIMLIELKKPLKPGDKVELNLKFEKVGVLKIQTGVKEMTDHTMHH